MFVRLICQGCGDSCEVVSAFGSALRALGRLRLQRVLAGLVLFVSMASTPAQAPGGCVGGAFETQVPFAIGFGPRAVLVCDFDLDGNPDLATANGFSDDVSVRLGDGQGGFGPENLIPVGDSPFRLATADFNLDGNPDIVVANDQSVEASVLWGDGTGGFVAVAVLVGDNSSIVATGDFNKDGNPDFASTTITNYSQPGDVAIVLGDGSGGFAAPVSFETDLAPQALAVEDVNLDGNQDLIVGCFSVVNLLLGDGQGGFGPPIDVINSSGIHSVGVGDFNADARPDIVATSGNVLVALADGTGGFSPVSPFFSPDYTRYVTVGDLNLDGNPDLAVSNFASVSIGESVGVRLGDGVGGFGPPVNHGLPSSFSGQSVSPVAIGDFNRDGAPDLVVARLEAHSVSVLLAVTCAPTGSGEDLSLESLINGEGDPGLHFKLARGGDVVEFAFGSPAGVFSGTSSCLAAQVFVTGSPPTGPISYPEVHLEPTATPAPSILAEGLLSPPGLTFRGAVPFGFAGVSLIAQGFSLATDARNGAFASTDAHEIRIMPSTPPFISGIDPTSSAAGSLVTISGHFFSPGLILDVNGVAVAPTSVTTSSIEFVRPAGVPCDAHVTVTNPDAQSASVAFNPAPTITTTAFGQGPAAGGATFFIGGAGFLPGTNVTIGGAPALITMQSPNILLVATPPGAVGPAQVVVTTAGGCTATTTYVYL